MDPVKQEELVWTRLSELDHVEPNQEYFKENEYERKIYEKDIYSYLERFFVLICFYLQENINN